MLQWLHQQGIAQSWRTCREAAEEATWMCSSGHGGRAIPGARTPCEAAAGNGHLAVLRWARHQGCAWGPSTCVAAARGGPLEVLQFAHQNGCGWNQWKCMAAARGGHLAVLQYALQNGCAWGPTVCSAAAEHGNFNFLKWLRQHGCPWGCWTNANAAVNGHLGVLKWARQQPPPCPWWSRLHTQILFEGYSVCPSVLVFLQQQQAPLGASYLAQARAAATKMTYAVLSLSAALPDGTPHEVVMNIVSLAFS